MDSVEGTRAVKKVASEREGCTRQHRDESGMQKQNGRGWIGCSQQDRSKLGL